MWFAALPGTLKSQSKVYCSNRLAVSKYYNTMGLPTKPVRAPFSRSLGRPPLFLRSFCSSSSSFSSSSSSFILSNSSARGSRCYKTSMLRRANRASNAPFRGPMELVLASRAAANWSGSTQEYLHRLQFQNEFRTGCRNMQTPRKPAA